MEEPKATSEELETTEDAEVGTEANTGEDGENAGAAAVAETPGLEEHLRVLEAEKKELYDRLLRQKADLENYRKRIDREARERRQFAETALVESLLPVLDAFERALAHQSESPQDDYHKGIEMIYSQLLDVLGRAGLKPLEVVGKMFDPTSHHAVERIETTDHADQEVVEELQRGYQFKDRLLRPALVKVAVHPPGSSTETGTVQ